MRRTCSLFCRRKALMVLAEGVTKDFILGERATIFGMAMAKRRPRTFRALDNIQFRVRPGEVLGVIGPNGAGKSTLLKVLCGVSRPTEGRVVLGGSSIAILELSTGFNPHLSGRENIRRRLTLQGLGNREIRKLEPDIIDFSELSEVIDEKVRTYSSGMGAKLAFSIVTAMPAEILFIDEILVVGDEDFQGKSFRKIKDVCASGRTVVIASHTINYVERLCHRAIWLDGGRIVMEGPAHDVGMAYYAQNAKQIDALYPREYGRIENMQVENMGERLWIRIVINRLREAQDLHLQVAVHDNDLGIMTALVNSSYDGGKPIPTGLGPVLVSAGIPKCPGLQNGLLAVALLRGSGAMPGSTVEDSWGWDNAKQMHFSQFTEPGERGYLGIPLRWHQCM